MELKTVEVNGKTYELSPYPAMLGWKRFTRLLRVVGAPLGLTLNNYKAGMNFADLQLEFGSTAKDLFENLDSEEGHELISTLVDTAFYQGKPLKDIKDTHFQGRIGDMFELAKCQIEYQYADFFTALVRTFKGLQVAKGSTKSRKG